MESIKSLFKPLPQKAKGPSSQRAELIGHFTDRLNASRDGKKYRKLSYAAVAVKLSHLKTITDLHFLKRTCEDAESRGYPWSAIFWKEITPNKNEK